MKTKKTLSDAQILQEVLDALNYNANSLNTKLGYSSASTIPHVLKGRNALSRGIKERLVNEFPNVNMNFLNNGELPILLTGGALQAQANLLNIPLKNKREASSIIDLSKVAQLPEQMDRIENMLQELLDNKKGPPE